MIRFSTTATFLLFATGAVAQVRKLVTMYEDEALTLPNGRKIVLTDDHKGKGVELYIEGAGLVRLPKGKSASVGEFVLTCEAYDLHGDAAIIGVSGPPMRVPHSKGPTSTRVRSSAPLTPAPRR